MARRTPRIDEQDTAMSENCAFCRIIRRQIPAYIITEDDQVIVFLSKENHPLVASKQHIPNIYFHMHVYPRWKAVDFQTQQTSEQVAEQDKQDTLRQIVAYLE